MRKKASRRKTGRDRRQKDESVRVLVRERAGEESRNTAEREHEKERTETA